MTGRETLLRLGVCSEAVAWIGERDPATAWAAGTAAWAVAESLAGFSAAWLLAPMVRVQRTTMLIEGSVDAAQTRELITAIGAKNVDSGANLTLWFARDPSMLYGGRTIDGRPVTSPIQTYLDCVGKAGRGEEAAQAVFEQLIQPSFARMRKLARPPTPIGFPSSRAVGTIQTKALALTRRANGHSPTA